MIAWQQFFPTSKVRRRLHLTAAAFYLRGICLALI
jgi:hypothetical protein